MEATNCVNIIVQKIIIQRHNIMAFALHNGCYRRKANRKRNDHIPLLGIDE